MAEEMNEIGVTIDCLPVLDVPQPGSHGVIGDRALSNVSNAGEVKIHIFFG